MCRLLCLHIDACEMPALRLSVWEEEITIVEELEVVNGMPICNYYGSLDQSVKPKYGVSLFVLDEYIARTMDKETNRARKELEKICSSIEKTVENMIKEFATLNGLKLPKKGGKKKEDE